MKNTQTMLPLVVAASVGVLLGRECIALYRRRSRRGAADFGVSPGGMTFSPEDEDDEIAEIIRKAGPALERARRHSLG